MRILIPPNIIIENTLPKFQPDLVIIYSGGNDAHGTGYGTEYNVPAVSSGLAKVSPSFFEIIKKITYDINYRTPFVLMEHNCTTSKLVTPCMRVQKIRYKNYGQQEWLKLAKQITILE